MDVIERIRAGSLDPADIKEAVDAYMHLARMSSYRLGQVFKGQRQFLIAEASVALFMFLIKKLPGFKGDFERSCRRYIKHSLLKWLYNDQVIRQPETSYRRRPEKLTFHDTSGLTTYDSTRIIDEIDSIAQNQTERRILLLRVEGYSDKEIGVQLGLSRSTIHEIRTFIKFRVQHGKDRIDP